MYRKTLQTSVAAAALFAFAAPFAGPASAAGNTIVNGKSQVKIAITGQLSRVVAVVEDGDTTNYHHVSNQFSGNRVRFIGTAKAWDSLTIGTRIEFQFNNRDSKTSGNVDGGDTIFNDSGIDEDTKDGSGIDARYQDITFAGKLGKLYVGKGDAANNGTSEVDLSGTIIAINPSVADMGFGGSHFIIESIGGLSLTTLGIPQDPNLNGGISGPVAIEVFSGFDGLSRTQRVRYDTPTFGGFKVSVGLNQGPIPDAAVRYSGSFAGTKVAAAVGWHNKSSASGTSGHQVNGSASVLHSSGLNVTIAAAVEDLKGKGNVGRDHPTMFYGKLGYKAKIFDAGTTNFFVAYQSTEDRLVISSKSDIGGALGGSGRTAFENQSDATFWGFGVVQILKDYATELFATFSVASLDDVTVDDSDISSILEDIDTSSLPSGKIKIEFEDLVTGLVGVRLKF